MSIQVSCYNNNFLFPGPVRNTDKTIIETIFLGFIQTALRGINWYDSNNNTCNEYLNNTFLSLAHLISTTLSTHFEANKKSAFPKSFSFPIQNNFHCAVFPLIILKDFPLNYSVHWCINPLKNTTTLFFAKPPLKPANCIF